MIAELAGVADRTAAEASCGKLVGVPRAALPPTAAGEYYWADLVGLAVINDIGDEKDIHPKNKQEVGRRLALWALAKDYGRSTTVFSGPMFKNSIIEGNMVRIQFDHVGGGLKVRGGGELKHFQIAGADQKWVWAQAKIENNEVIVSSDAVPAPVGVRYAWAAWPEGANLINAEGLPASCFRTDEFIPSTLGVVSPFQEVLKAQSR